MLNELYEEAERRLEDECRNGDEYTQAYWRGYRDAIKRAMEVSNG